MADKVIIKRYANRRLYNTESSSFVNLMDISDIIRRGDQVEIVDLNTDEDLTAYILTQILLEEAKKKKILLPASLLHVAIRFGNNVLAEFFDKHLLESIKHYASYKNIADDQFRKWLNLTSNISAKSKETVEKINPISKIRKRLFKNDEDKA